MTDSNSNIVQESVRIVRLTDNVNLDDFILVWLDAQLDSSEDCLEATKSLRAILNKLHTFTDLASCRNFLTNANPDYDRICIIVSGTLSSALLIPAIVDLPQVVMTAIYCLDSSKYTIDRGTDSITNVKFLGAFAELDTLLTKLHERVVLLLKTFSTKILALFDVSNTSVKDLSHQNAIFVWFHLLMHTLFKLPRNEEARLKMIEACVAYYYDNDAQLKEIRNFSENYKPDQAVEWYTRDSFVYRIINRALRTQNIEIIFLFAPFIGDLHDQLVLLHQEFQKLDAPELLMVYRGQQMQTNEVQRIVGNIGGLVSMNTFFSTSFDRSLSRVFAEAGSGLASVLYEITIDTEVSAAPFSNVGDNSSFHSELEILFSVDAIFRVESAAEETDENGHMWLIKLRLVNERTEQTLTALIDHFMSHLIGDHTSMLTICALLQHMGDVQGAERFLLCIHKALPADDPQQAIFYDQLGAIRIFDPDIPVELFFEEALHLFESAETFASYRNLYIATTLTNMSVLYMCKGDQTKANELLVRAMKLEEECPLIAEEHVYQRSLPTLINASVVLYKSGHVRRALKYHENLLSLCTRLLPQTHPTVATIHEHLGIFYSQIGNSSQAILHHLQSHTIRIQISPARHLGLARSYTNMGWRYIESGDYTLAQNHFEQALLIHDQHQFLDNPASLNNTLMGLAAVSRRQGKLDDALTFLKRASTIFLSDDHPDRNHIDQQMGKVLMELSRYEEAEDTFQRALNRSAQSDNNLETAELELSIGQLYCRMKQRKQAIHHFELALQIHQLNGAKADPATAKILHEIGSVFYSTRQYTAALDCMRRCLDIEQKSLEANHIDIARSHNSIASVLYELKEYTQALEEAELAVQIALCTLETSNPAVIEFKQCAALIKCILQTELKEI